MNADNEQRADAAFRAVAYGLYVLSALLIGVLVLWAYRMMRFGGSLSDAWQMAISLGWRAAAFVAITSIGAAVCSLAATSILNAGRGRE
jgi:hypothetical protein